MEPIRRQLFLVIAYVACIAALGGCSRESDPVAPADPYAHLLLDTFDCDSAPTASLADLLIYGSGIARRMYSSNSGTVKAMSPCAGL
jgi:hypothetical protein